MFIGHFGVALAAKKVAPNARLGTLVIAAQLLDLLWPPLLLLGVEEVKIVPGITTFSPFDFTRYPISHSLLMVGVWSTAFGLLYYLWRRAGRSAVVIGLLVASHWVLDFIVHRPDLPLAPGTSARFGLGLWNSIPGTLIVEGVIFLTGAFLYAGATRALDRTGRFAFWGYIVFLIISYVASFAGPPPDNPKSIAWVSLSVWLLVAWAYWIDRHRRSLGGSSR
jgi:hypothetical protein